MAERKATQTGLRLPDDVLGRAKYIAWYERETLTDRVVNALSADIEKWEKKNGPITQAMIEKAVKK